MDELNVLLDQFDKRQEANQKRASEYAKASETFAEHFLELQKSIILPTLGRIHD